MNLRVIRVIEFKGPEEWIMKVLGQSWLQEYPSEKALGTGCSARELARYITVDETEENKT